MKFSKKSILAAGTLLLLGTIIVTAGTGNSPPAGKRPVVWVISVREEVDLGLAPFVKRAVKEANEAGAAFVVVDINTFGGRMDAMVEICEAIDGAECPTVAFCRYNALSAGSLIALACDRIFIKKGSTIGAATPVYMHEGQMRKAPEKVVSAARSMFRSWAQKKKHPVSIAEAMVDEDIELYEVEVKGKKRYLTQQEIDALKNEKENLEAVKVLRVFCPRGKLLTLTSKEAVECGLAEAEVESLNDLLAHLGVGNAEIVHTSMNWAERTVRFLTNPMVASILMLLGFLGIYIEMKTPGIGVPLLIGLTCFALFFGSRYIVYLAGYLEILLFTVGLLLLLIEIFLIPGFGVFGISGIAMIIVALVLSFVPGGTVLPRLPWEWFRFQQGLISVSAALAALVVCAVLLVRFLPSMPYLNRLILEEQENQAEGFVVHETSSPPVEVGRKGTAVSPLRPTGKVEFDGVRMDAMAEGEFIEKDSSVVVVDVKPGRITVRKG